MSLRVGQNMLILCGVVLLAFPRWVRACPDGGAAYEGVEDLFHRSKTGAPPHATNRIAIETFSDSETVRKLQLIHVTDYQRYSPGMAGIRSQTFNPTWIFRDPEALDILIENFPNSMAVSPKPGQPAAFHGIDGFLQKWEADFTNAGGTISPVWNRNRFIQQFLLELAYRHKQEWGYDSDEQPPHFVRGSPDSPLSLLVGSATIENAFGTIEAFHRQARDFARRRDGLRTPYAPLRATPELRAMARTLRDRFGINVEMPQPIRREDARTRERQEWVTLALEGLRNHANPRTRLLALSQQNDDDNGGLLDVFTKLERINYLFGNFNNYINAINAHLDKPLRLGRGATTWGQELLIQAGISNVMANTSRTDQFTGFQSSDPDAPFYIHERNSLLRHTGFTLAQLSVAVRNRLP